MKTEYRADLHHDSHSRTAATCCKVPLRYWIMRTLRKNAPQSMIDAMLDRGILLRPGRDTEAPQESVLAYTNLAARHGLSLSGRTVCVVGFGGGYGVGIGLLESGAKRVILQDPYAPERTWRNRSAVDEATLAKYMQREGQGWRPRDERLEVVRQQLDVYAAEHRHSIDLVVSNSVLEHVTGLDRLIDASATLMRPDGLAIHFVDLRDHYFRYPFEMLCYSEAVWEGWLNASNTLNRLRTGHYESIFKRHFGQVEINVLERLPEEFAKAKPRIRPEFLTGNDEVDATARISIEARSPLTLHV